MAHVATGRRVQLFAAANRALPSGVSAPFFFAEGAAALVAPSDVTGDPLLIMKGNIFLKSDIGDLCTRFL